MQGKKAASKRQKHLRGKKKKLQAKKGWKAVTWIASSSASGSGLVYKGANEVMRNRRAQGREGIR